MNTIMSKRGRGRPRKIAPNNLSDICDTDKSMVKSDGAVVYSDEYPEFFKIYLPEICSEVMRIPPDFIEKFGGNIPNIVTLRTPGTMTWQVDVKKIDEHWFFEKGWPHFVKENSLQDGDFMTFSYAAHSIFFVKIFARNGCRKSVDTTAIADDGQSVENHQSSQSSENSKLNDVLVGRNISTENRIARKNPCFSQIILKSYYNRGCIHVPMKFWRECMSKHAKGSTTVTLRVENNSWVVGLYDVGDRVSLNKGWIQFVKDNSLRTGNECTFELIDTTDLVFKVTFNK